MLPPGARVRLRAPDGPAVRWTANAIGGARGGWAAMNGTGADVRCNEYRPDWSKSITCDFAGMSCLRGGILIVGPAQPMPDALGDTRGRNVFTIRVDGLSLWGNRGGFYSGKKRLE